MVSKQLHSSRRVAPPSNVNQLRSKCVHTHRAREVPRKLIHVYVCMEARLRIGSRGHGNVLGLGRSASTPNWNALQDKNQKRRLRLWLSAAVSGVAQIADAASGRRLHNYRLR